MHIDIKKILTNNKRTKDNIKTTVIIIITNLRTSSEETKEVIQLNTTTKENLHQLFQKKLIEEKVIQHKCQQY